MKPEAIQTENKRPFFFYRRVKLNQANQEEIFKLPAGRAFLLRRVTIKQPNYMVQSEAAVSAPGNLAPPSYVVMADPAGYPVPFEWRAPPGRFKAFRFHAIKYSGTRLSTVVIDRQLMAADCLAFNYEGTDVYQVRFPELSAYGLPQDWIDGEPVGGSFNISFTVAGVNATTDFATAETPQIVICL